jgi:serine/threonine protein kinase
MPNNTWFTPYRLPPSTCLSLGPSQGIVFELSDEAVIKVPFQYPVTRSPPTDETNDQIYISLRSLALFKRESAFYTVLAKYPHANLAQRLPSKFLSGIVLPRFRSLEQIWSLHTRKTHFTWIKQLVNAVAWLENLGYTHGDLKILNMGINSHDQLQLFDFGSVMHCDDEGFSEQVLEDHFALATCIHFIASGVDPIAKANSYAEVQRVHSTLKGGQGIVDEEARDFRKVIQEGWTGAVSSFSSLKKGIADIGDDMVDQSGLSEAQSDVDHLTLEEDPRWMNEEAYRAAWQAQGYETPDDVWN